MYCSQSVPKCTQVCQSAQQRRVRRGPCGEACVLVPSSSDSGKSLVFALLRPPCVGCSFICFCLPSLLRIWELRTFCQGLRSCFAERFLSSRVHKGSREKLKHVVRLISKGSPGQILKRLLRLRMPQGATLMTPSGHAERAQLFRAGQSNSPGSHMDGSLNSE